MDFNLFSRLLQDHLPPGLALDNPGGGTSTIVSCDENRILYLRGKSPIPVKTHDLYEAYLQFAAGDVTTRQLKEYAPAIFVSKKSGHNCNGTFFFLAMQQIGLAGPIYGSGRRGSPFGVTLASNPASAPTVADAR